MNHLEVLIVGGVVVALIGCFVSAQFFYLSEQAADFVYKFDRGVVDSPFSFTLTRKRFP